jgi:hypothetical protein
LEVWLVGCALAVGATFAVANSLRVATFDINGLAGTFIDLNQPLTGEPASAENSNRGYTMTSIVRKLPTQTSRSIVEEGLLGRGIGGRPVAASLTYFSLLLCLTCLAAPAASVVLALALGGLVRRNVGLQCCGHRSHGAAIRTALDTALAWCGLDVLALACVAGWWQIDLIAQWLIEDQFEQQCNALAKKGHQCIEVDTTLLQGFWWMAACAVACLAMSGVFTRLCGVADGLLDPKGG